MFDLVEKVAPPGTLIAEFRGEHSWLSNFSPSALWWEGVHYPSAEHAFQAGKTLDLNVRQQIADAPTPGRAKQLGRSLTLRADWNRVRHDVMRAVLAAKFATPSLADQLIATGTALLVEGNDHHDNDWGWCRCPRHAWRPGANLLGRALMRQRAALNPEQAMRWTRVAATGHRPGKIPKGLRDWVQHELDRVAAKVVKQHGTEVAISGLAIGSDLWWAKAAHNAGARVWGYSPYPDQDQRWTQPWKTARQEVIASAERVEHLGASFSNALLALRNRWMIRDADALVAVVDTSRTDGGTVAAFRLACGQIPVVLIDVLQRDVRLLRPAR